MEVARSCPSTDLHLLPHLPWVRNDGHCEETWGIQNPKIFTKPSSQEKLTEQGIFLAVADDVAGFTPERGD